MINNEQWKPVEGFPNYEVSNLGNVRKLPHTVQIEYTRKDGVVVTQQRKYGLRDVSVSLNSGRAFVAMSDDGIPQTTRSLTHIVADAFVERPSIEHVHALLIDDSDPSNCRADNIEWSVNPTRIDLFTPEMVEDFDDADEMPMIMPSCDEEWRDWPGSEIYEVSSYGKVRSKGYESNFTKRNGTVVRRWNKQKEIAQSDDGYGYLTVNVRMKDGSMTKSRVHRMVAETFIPNPGEKETVNHKDGRPSNNVVDNLEWMSYAENTQHARRTGLFKDRPGERASGSKLTWDQVDEIRRRYASTSVTQAQLGEEYGITAQSIGAIISGKTWNRRPSELN